MKNTGKKQNERQKSVNVPQAYAFGGWSGGTSGFGQRKVPLDWQLLLEYACNGIVRACVDLNAKAVADVCRHVYRQAPLGSVPRSKRIGHAALRHLRSKSFVRQSADLAVEEVDDHPLADLVRRAEVEFQFSFVTSAYLDVLGRAFWLKEINPVTGWPDRLLPLTPHCLRENSDDSGTVVSYKYTVEGTPSQTFPAERVIAFRPPVIGVAKSPLAAVYAQTTLSTKLLDYENTLLNNRARPELIMNPKGDAALDEDSAKRLLQSFRQKFRGRGNGEPFIPPFGLDIIPLTMPPVDLGPLEIRQATLRETSAALGTPEPLVHGNASTYSNLKTAMAQHGRTTVSPRVTYYENVLNEQLVPDFEDDSLFVAYDNAVPADDEAELRERAADLQGVQVAAQYGVVTVNELRAIAGLDPIPGGDALIAPPSVASPPNPSESSESSEEPRDDDQPAAGTSEQRDEPDDAKAFDVDALLRVNTAVSKNDMPRAVAINVVARAFGLSNSDAKQLVGFPVQVMPEEDV